MNREQKREARTPEDEQRRESGMPGGGQGRVDEVGRSSVYPASGPLPEGPAEARTPAAWGQGARGAAGYKDHGESETFIAQQRMGRAPEKCRDVMTKDPVCCLPDDTVDVAAQIMKTADIGPIPVVTDMQTKRLIGIVTDRDLALRVVAEGRDPQRTQIEDVMTRDLVTCSPDDDIRQTLDLMARHQIRRIPVVDNSGRIVGIIAQADVATRIEEPQHTAEVVKSISQRRVPVTR